VTASSEYLRKVAPQIVAAVVAQPDQRAWWKSLLMDAIREALEELSRVATSRPKNSHRRLTMTEIEWKPVPGYPNYEVSDRGEIRRARAFRALLQKECSRSSRNPDARDIGKSHSAMERATSWLFLRASNCLHSLF
jgi:hypothetical protein